MSRPSALRILLALLAAGLAACARDARPLEERLQAAMEKRLRQYDVKGASAAVILPDGTLHRATAGVSHGMVAMDPDMAFAVGSITKNMVAALTLQLAEEGKLSLEDPIGKWLPAYPHVNGAVTIRQLLNHTSGLYMFFDNQALWDDLIRDRERIFTPEEVLGYLKEPYFAPGKGFRYSNTNYLLAAMIAEKATGSTLAIEMRKRFWEPLGLAGARLPLEEPYPEHMTHVWGDYFEKGGAYRDMHGLPRASHDSIGCPTAFMTAGDMARWTHALFHGKVIGPRSLGEMRTGSAWNWYGLGLQRFGWRIAGWRRVYGHSGASMGTSAYMIYLPDRDVSVTVMINNFGGKCLTAMTRDAVNLAAAHWRPPTVAERLKSPEGLLSALWLLAGSGALLYAIRKRRPLVLCAFSAGFRFLRNNSGHIPGHVSAVVLTIGDDKDVAVRQSGRIEVALGVQGVYRPRNAQA